MSGSEPTSFDTPVGTRPRGRRPLPRTRRIANACIGALAGGAAGAAAGWLAFPPDRIVPWIIGTLALLGAALGYRHGRGVVRAAARSLFAAWW